jgi:hypothetical protein
MPWLGYPNEVFDFWRPDDGRNRTCFFVQVKGKPLLQDEIIAKKEKYIRIFF